MIIGVFVVILLVEIEITGVVGVVRYFPVLTPLHIKNNIMEHIYVSM